MKRVVAGYVITSMCRTNIKICVGNLAHLPHTKIHVIKHWIKLGALLFFMSCSVSSASFNSNLYSFTYPKWFFPFMICTLKFYWFTCYKNSQFFKVFHSSPLYHFSHWISSHLFISLSSHSFPFISFKSLKKTSLSSLNSDLKYFWICFMLFSLLHMPQFLYSVLNFIFSCFFRLHLNFQLCILFVCHCLIPMPSIDWSIEDIATPPTLFPLLIFFS